MSPIGTATVIASSVATTPARIDARAPQKMRESTSRPSSSVPSRCSRDGDWRSALKSVSDGECGAIQRREQRDERERQGDDEAGDRERAPREPPAHEPAPPRARRENVGCGDVDVAHLLAPVIRIRGLRNE